VLNLVHSAFFLVPSKGVTKNFLTKDPNIGNQQSIAIMFKGVLLAASVATASAFSGATLPVRGNVARKLPCFLFLFLRPVGTVCFPAGACYELPLVGTRNGKQTRSIQEMTGAI
jgi:hypothetical protein